jgi:MAF protein
MPVPPLILASSSPYRRALLEKLRVRFEVAVPDVDEAPRSGEGPAELVRRLARAKAEAVAASREAPVLVIGSDQVASLDGAILTKPGSDARAREQLAACSGRAVRFHTGVALVDTRTAAPAVRVEEVPFDVVFRTLSADEIDRYVTADAPLDCAGSIRSEGFGVTLFERMEGTDPNALVGLPLIRVAALLREAGVTLP